MPKWAIVLVVVILVLLLLLTQTELFSIVGAVFRNFIEANQ